MARSWGTVLGILTVHNHPELFKAYIGIGQIVNPLQNDQLSYRYSVQLAEKYKNKNALFELKKLGQPPYDFRQLLIQRKWLTKFYKRLMNNKESGKLYDYGTTLKRLLSTPEYSLIDIFRMGFDPYFCLRNLWNENYYQLNFFDQIKEIEVPIYFLAGKTDYFSVSELGKKFYDGLNAPWGKKFFWFENSGHHPSKEEPKKFYQTILEIINEVERK
jgi:pimeloyl-ACP methyl ester carboxylesterase